MRFDWVATSLIAVCVVLVGSAIYVGWNDPAWGRVFAAAVMGGILARRRK